MRRFVASLVLSVMAWSFVAPMASALTGTDVPACCRRDGKHHCMAGMSGMSATSTDGPFSFRSSSSVCPYRSRIAAPAGLAHPQSPVDSTLQPPLATVIAIVDCVSFESRLTTSNSQRGPPAFYL